MKKLTSIILGLLLIGSINFMGSNSVKAGNDGLFFGLGLGFGYVIGNVTGHYHDHHDHYDHHHYQGPTHYHGPQYRNVCHTFKEQAYWNGHLALVGSTMCYDHFNQPYIVPNSHYLIYYIH